MLEIVIYLFVLMIVLGVFDKPLCCLLSCLLKKRKPQNDSTGQIISLQSYRIHRRGKLS